MCGRDGVCVVGMVCGCVVGRGCDCVGRDRIGLADPSHLLPLEHFHLCLFYGLGFLDDFLCRKTSGALTGL